LCRAAAVSILIVPGFGFLSSAGGAPLNRSPLQEESWYSS
jgi:hypothetical protein